VSALSAPEGIVPRARRIRWDGAVWAPIDRYAMTSVGMAVVCYRLTSKHRARKDAEVVLLPVQNVLYAMLTGDEVTGSAATSQIHPLSR
jgi:hypothetical protein